MAANYTNAVQSKEARSIESVRLAPAKAHLESRTESNAVEPDLIGRLGSIAESVLMEVHGKKGAAAVLFEAMSQRAQRRGQI